MALRRYKRSLLKQSQEDERQTCGIAQETLALGRARTSCQNTPTSHLLCSLKPLPHCLLTHSTRTPSLSPGQGLTWPLAVPSYFSGGVKITIELSGKVWFPLSPDLGLPLPALFSRVSVGHLSDSSVLPGTATAIPGSSSSFLCIPSPLCSVQTVAGRGQRGSALATVPKGVLDSTNTLRVKIEAKDSLLGDLLSWQSCWWRWQRKGTIPG